MDPEVIALGGVISGLVGHAVQDMWAWGRRRLVALFAGGGAEDEAVVDGELEEARRRAVAAGERGDDETVAEVTDAVWGRVLDVFAARPGAVREARELVGEALTRATAGERVSALLHFVDRTAVFAEMDRHWRACRDAGAVTAVFLGGVRGVGRRSVARQWVHRHQDALAGVFLRADLGIRDGRIAEPATALERWLDELGVPREERPADPPAMARRVRDELGGRPVVFLLENVTTTRQVRELLTDRAYGVVLMTGHRAPHDLAGALDHLPLTVPVLEDEHALELLVKVSRTTEDPAKLEPIVRRLGGLPLALRLIAGHLRTPVPGLAEDLGARLADRAVRQELLAVDDPDPLPQALDLAYAQLDAPAALLYRRLGMLFPGEFQLDTVFALTPDREPAVVRAALGVLLSGGLVERRGLDSYRMHVLVHDHAAGVADGDHLEVRRWVTAHFLRLVERGERALSSRWLYDPAQAAPADGLPGEAEALRELGRRAAGVFAVIPWAAEAGLHGEVRRLSQSVRTFCLRTGRFTEWVEATGAGLASALEGGDTTAVARASYEAGFARLERWNVAEGDPARARELFGQALSLVNPGVPGRDEAARRTESSVLEGLGLLERKLRRPGAALPLFDRARGALAGIDHPRGHALLTLHLGVTYTALGRYDDAEGELLDAVRAFGELSDAFNKAKAQLRLGENRCAAGRLRAAVEVLDKAVDGLAADYWAAHALLVRGDVRLRLGEREGAREDWEAARVRYKGAHSEREGEAVRRLAGG
ncbi:hypothetical protein SRB5_36560 [Streptomyces sp. RB5]|uniref:Tetratricopeptide repeat protein n=1 Tax=Streptomyces smaragdinus TaxID=2585196 RepID=A0A7K0CJ73_9ACTN|nr:hypothetical protein [Streptomyces smaragdinus]MQY13508.1 hypothetical protein [Streptomyces smaragdinus]